SYVRFFDLGALRLPFAMNLLHLVIKILPKEIISEVYEAYNISRQRHIHILYGEHGITQQ
ncbi:unnamed protein product, partial [Rotaria magnacalcarata]